MSSELGIGETVCFRKWVGIARDVRTSRMHIGGRRAGQRRGAVPISRLPLFPHQAKQHREGGRGNPVIDHDRPPLLRRPSEAPHRISVIISKVIGKSGARGKDYFSYMKTIFS